MKVYCEMERRQRREERRLGRLELATLQTQGKAEAILQPYDAVVSATLSLAKRPLDYSNPPTCQRQFNTLPSGST